VCKFFESPEQVLVGSLARPVRGHYAHYHTRHSEDQEDDDGCFHMIKVPRVTPRYMAIAIAPMNMLVMIQNRSII